MFKTLKSILKHLESIDESLMKIAARGDRGVDPFSNAVREIDDDMYQEALRAVKSQGYASPALLQRKLRVGYARAARLMDLLEEQGEIGEADGAKPRKLL